MKKAHRKPAEYSPILCRCCWEELASICGVNPRTLTLARIVDELDRLIHESMHYEAALLGITPDALIKLSREEWRVRWKSVLEPIAYPAEPAKPRRPRDGWVN